MSEGLLREGMKLSARLNDGRVIAPAVVREDRGEMSMVPRWIEWTDEFISLNQVAQFTIWED